MQTFVLEGLVYRTGEEPRPVKAEVNAPTLHWAKRLMVQDILAHGLWVKEITIASPEEHPWNEGESNGRT